MCRTGYRALAFLGLLFCCLLPDTRAGNLAKADIERMVDYYYVVGEILPDVPVYPLFMKDAATPDAKPELKAYVFESIDFAPARGYSGKPINLLIIMDLSGHFLKVRLLDHKEPLFLDSAGNLKLERFASQYKGLSTRHAVEIGPYNDPGLRDEQVAHLKGVQQGTISVKAINRAILQAAAAVATAKLRTGADDIAQAPVSPPVSKETKEIKEPPATDALEHRADAGKEARTVGTPENKTAMAAAVQPNAQALAVPKTGATSPSRAEAADAAAGTGGSEVAARLSNEPVAAPLVQQVAQVPQASSPPFAPSADNAVDYSEMQDWINAWQSRRRDIAILLSGLVVLSIALIAQKRFSANRRRMRQRRTLFLLFTLVFVGWIAQGQLTIVNITAALESLGHGEGLGFLMNDPMTVILWLFVGASLLIWGRGTFCGWLCPFGALQELISLLANALGKKQRRLRAALDTRLKGLKYLILAVLIVSLYASPPLAELLVEIEPFKTAISLYFVRDWPYVAWAVFCLLLSVFVYRGYCRYICPLGAALASAGILRFWSWIPRRTACGAPCQTCRHRCEYQAISPVGQINYSECFQCLDCVSIYQDEQRCFPLIRLRTESRAVIKP